MAASTKGKAQLESAKTLKTSGSAKADAQAAAAIAHFVATDASSDLETRATASVLERELQSPATAEDSARRDLLMQSLASFASKA